jgi:hypothetical protein
MNDLAFVQRAVALLRAKGVNAWVFGGWGEELCGLITPRGHADLDLLFPAPDWRDVDRLELDWVAAKRFAWKRAFVLDRVVVELFLVERDDDGWYTQLKRRRHDWPADVFADRGRLPVASTAALASYRHSYRVEAA